MNHMNNILLEGFVSARPKELARAKPGEKWGSFVKFEMMSTRQYRNRKEEIVEEKLWIGIQCWGTVAETVGKYLDEGAKVRVVGRLKLNTWKNREGKNRRDLEIVASHIEFRRPWEKEEPGMDRRKPRPEDMIVIDDGGELQRTGEPEFVYTYD